MHERDRQTDQEKVTSIAIGNVACQRYRLKTYTRVQA